MFKSMRENWKEKRFGMKSLVTAASTSLLAGLLVASGFNLTRPSSAAQVSTGAATVQTQGSSGETETPGIQRDSFAPLAAKLTPSVVNIKVVKVERTAGPIGPMPDGPFGDLFEHFMGQGGRMPESQAVEAAGSGVIISPDGYILTNNHVVESAREVTVTLAGHKEVKAKIVGRDPKTDLAILKVSSDGNLPAAKLGDSNHLQVGDWVLAIGNPFGLSHTVTSGIVSAKGRIIGAGPYDDFIQTDASINPGNSGGPLFNMKGEVVGINTAILSGGQGIGFAIPIDTAKPLIPQLETKGEVTRGYIGVNIQNITPELASAMNSGNAKGALVADVVPNGPADKAGIRSGDIIVSFNGKAITDSHDLPVLVASSPVGEKVPVTVLRSGKEDELQVKIARLGGEDTSTVEPAATSQGKWGLELQDLDSRTARQYGLNTDRGVLVVGVKPGSPADLASLRNGDIILEVNRQPVKSAAEIKAKLDGASSSDTALLLVQRDGAKLFAAMKS